MWPIFKKLKWCVFIVISMFQPACKHPQINAQTAYHQYLKAHQVAIDADVK